MTITRHPARAIGALTVAVAGAVGFVVPAGASTSTVPTGLLWMSPHRIQVGVARRFRSVDPCPATHADGSPLLGTNMVQLTVIFPQGGGIGNVFPVAADGSWVAAWDPKIDPAAHHRATIYADCLDVTVTGIATAHYEPHRIRLT